MWQSRPVFISSTFADMQAERDYLRTRVFPELEERLRARRHNLEWVDLRVGVATASESNEQLRELHVLKVCLDEVRRCRPFLIVLLGDRYGWVPPEERIKAAAEEAREGFSADAAGRSVTDLEIEFGVLSDPEQQPRSFFYFREPLPYADMPAKIAALYCEDYAADPAKADRQTRFAALKRRIGAQLPARIRRYAAGWDAVHNRVTGLDDFGRMVLDDIWTELDAETKTFAAAADISWQQAEREALEDFIDDRARDFVGRQGILNSLTGLAIAAESAGAMWGACITGDPGSGKSALFGALYRHLRGVDVFLLAHAAGASVNAGSVDSMLRRWLSELAGALSTDPGLSENADPDTVDAAFARLLGQMAQRRRVVLLVDALDQFENTTRSRYVTWLPRLWPANARFIATAILGEASKALAERQGLEALSLPPLDAAEASDIVASICRRYHRTFEPEVIAALLAKRGPNGPAWSQPLWLVLAVEDLNLLDADDFARARRDYSGEPGEQLRALMLDRIANFPPDIPGLYAQAFARAEHLFGASQVRGFLGLIAVSRAGWRESDFRVLLPRSSGENWDELKFAQLRRLFRGQMRRRGALARWDFNHAQMRAAVHAWLSVKNIREQSLHSTIVHHLESCVADDPLRQSEMMFHLLGAEELSRAAGYYGDTSLDGNELEYATRTLSDAVVFAEGGTQEDTVSHLCRLLETADIDDVARIQLAYRFTSNLYTAIKNNATPACRLTIADRVERLFKQLHESYPKNPHVPLGLMGVCLIRGGALSSMGRFAEAVKCCREGLRIAESVDEATDELGPVNLNRQDFLSRLHLGLGRALLECGQLREALEAYADGCMAARLGADIQEARGGTQIDWTPLITSTRAAYANLMAEQGGALEDTISTLRDGLIAIERLVATDAANIPLQSLLAGLYCALGDRFLKQGKPDEALKYCHSAVAVAERLVGAVPDDRTLQSELAEAFGTLASVLRAQGRLDDAVKFSREGLSIVKRLAQGYPGDISLQSDLSISCREVGELLEAQEHTDEALVMYHDSLNAEKSVAAADRNNVSSQRAVVNLYSKIGQVLQAQRRTDEAGSYYAEGLIVAQQAAASNTSLESQFDLCICYDTLGAFNLAEDKFEPALKAFRNGLTAAERLANTDRNNADAQRRLAVSCWNLGAAYQRHGDSREAFAHCLRAWKIMAILVAIFPDNKKLQNEFAGMQPQWPRQRSIFSRIIRFPVIFLKGFKLAGKLDAGMEVVRNPEDIRAHFIRGKMFLGMKGHREAIAEFREVVRLARGSSNYKETVRLVLEAVTSSQ